MSDDLACIFSGKETKLFRPIRGQGCHPRFLITLKRTSSSSKPFKEH